MARKKIDKEATAAAEVVDDMVTGDRARLKALGAVSKKFGKWRPARDVLVRVQAVPTIFPWFDMATRVGGLPLSRFGLVHGPSNNGKTMFTNGLGMSFLARDHFFGLVDAERTTPITWLEQLMGAYADHPGFCALRPSTYEETVDETRRFLTEIGEARERGDIPKETTGLIVVDSIRKLVPENILAKILKEGAEGERGSIDGMGGRAAQIKAALNAAWLDEVTMLLEQTNTAMIAIARETEDVNASANDRKYGNDFKVTGGKALIFDSSLVVRVTRPGWNYVGSKEDRETVGEKHQVRIWKTKVGGKEDRHTDSYFNSSNGKLVPEGFDRARDLVELAEVLDVTKSSGGWISWPGGSQRWQGVAAAVRKLSANPQAFAKLDEEVRAKFSSERAKEVLDAPTEEP